jgi:hypothetical protein
MQTEEVKNAVVKTRPGPVTMPGEGRSFFADEILPGAITGIVGGAVMMFLWCCLCAAVGKGFFAPPKMIAGVFYRYSELRDLGTGPVLLGLFIHFNISIALATGFAMMLPRPLGDTWFGITALGLFYSMFAFVLMTELVVEWASPLMQREMANLNTFFWLFHLAWGGFLGMIPALRRTRQAFVRRMPVFLRRPITV